MALKQLSDGCRSVSISRRADAEKLADLRCRFHHVYPNLPIGERGLPCIVIKIADRSEPLSWRVCYTEINHDTPLSRKILLCLGEMEFI
jgi:hypothetical protein